MLGWNYQKNLHLYFLTGLEPKPDTETRVRRNDIFIAIMVISIALHFTLHIKIKHYKIKVENTVKNSNNINGHHREKFVLSIDKMSATNFASSAIVFCTFILSNHVINHINAAHPSKLEKYPNNILVYLYYLAIFNIHSISVTIWYFIRMPKLTKTIFREFKNALRIQDFF